MPWGRGGLEKLVTKSASRLIKGVPKGQFLSQLEEAWSPHVKKGTDIEAELILARTRINSSGPFKKAFEDLNITNDDLRQLLRNIQENKPEPYVREAPKVGRNDPCSCGSGKKYKNCCGR